MVQCLAIVAAICFHNFHSMNFTDKGLSAEVDVSFDNVKALVYVRMDNPQSLAWERAAGACNELFCVAYFKYCEGRDGEFKCTYHYSEPGLDPEHVLELSAPTKAELVTAEKSIGVLPSLGPMSSEISLANLDVASPTNSPPYCRSGGRLPDCWPLRRDGNSALPMP